jgi:hypothetical protein
MPIPLRTDFAAGGLRTAARQTKDAAQARRLLALAAIYDGASRTEAARIGGVTLQIVRDWVLRLNAEGPAGLVDRKAPGQAARLNDSHRAALAAALESGPIPAIHGVVDTARGPSRVPPRERDALRAAGPGFGRAGGVIPSPREHDSSGIPLVATN